MCLDVELALLVGDGAAMRHFTDYMRVADRMKAVGSDHIAVEVYALALRFVLALGESGGEAQHQGRYDKKAFQFLGFWTAKIQQIANDELFFLF